MNGERFLRKLFDDMIMRYRIEREERREKLAKESGGSRVVFVHELLECPHKQKMRERFPEIELASTLNPRFVIGWLIEEGVRKMVGAESVRWHKRLDDTVIAGEADLVTGDRVIEVKFLSSLYGTPHEHHVDQLRMYLWGLDREIGELWMFSPEGVIFNEYQKMTDEEVRERLSRVSNSQTPLYEWECKLCIFEQFCEKSNRRERR